MGRSPIIPLLIIGLIITAAIVAGQRQVVSSPGSGSQTNGGHNAQAAVQATNTPVVEAELAPTPTEPPTPTIEPTPKPQTVPPAVAQQIEVIEAEASDLRGLKPLDDVPATFVTRAEFHQRYKQ